jgi:hypothetical protein
MSVPKFRHTVEKIQKIGRNPMYGGGNPLYNMPWGSHVMLTQKQFKNSFKMFLKILFNIQHHWKNVPYIETVCGVYKSTVHQKLTVVESCISR